MKNLNEKNVTSFECPICHAKFALPEHQHYTSGIVIGKDSGLGVIHPMLEGEQSTQPSKVVIPTHTPKAQARIDALKAAGVKGNFFAISCGSDSEVVGRQDEDGTIRILADDDPVFAKIATTIIKKGDVNNSKLFRRWIMGQWIHGELMKYYRSNAKSGFTKYIRYKGYEYQFKTTLEEFHVQARLVKNGDADNYEIRSRWQGYTLGIALITHDIKMCREYVNGLYTRYCKRRPYKRIRGVDYFVDDLEERLFSKMTNALKEFRKSSIPAYMEKAFAEYMRVRINLPWDTEQCKEWVDAYKGVGAEYNMRNFVMFHNCFLFDQYGNPYSKELSLKKIEEAGIEHSRHGEGWCMLGMLRQMLKDNHIDIAAMQKEWRSKK